MILDHINGVSNDHRKENLRMVCPNCNSQLETHCGRNRVNKKRCECGVTISRNANSCRSCSSKSEGIKRRVVDRPEKQELIEELKNSNFCKTGRKHGVSDNTIRKWCKYYDITL